MQSSYEANYSFRVANALKILKNRDRAHYNKLNKQIQKIKMNPHHTYKFLKHDLKGKNRVHIGHFVLVFEIDHENKTIYFDDYEHHDKIYH